MLTISPTRLTGDTKTIEIRTVRNLWSKVHSYLRYIPFAEIYSYIGLSLPIKDFKEKENSNLTLLTSYDKLSDLKHWRTMLGDKEDKVFLESKPFEALIGPFEDYSEARIKRWVETGINYHTKCLRRIEDLFWDEKEISQDFFNLT